ncbi:MAG: asparagine synthase (glutamine-hydrolyzing) [Actinomycetota bacterium]|nr:asparagine synthase (glutamine-hydrolyzing) [Actinomycetota bacterium]
MDVTGGKVDSLTARAMRDVLAHRGPEGEGEEWLAGEGLPSVYLGHRRLKIIDLSDAASQPLANEDGNILVTFNGEIYNYRELARELEGKGHLFRSRSDTEVIVHGYEEYGDRVAEHLDGMFAFGIWDGRRQRLLLGRDRAGKKPLFYHFDGRRLAFASEIKALLVCPWILRDVDHRRLGELLAYGYVSAPKTLLRGIVQLEPASCLVLEASGMPRVWRYWGMELDSAPGETGFDQACDGVRERLSSAVRKRLISDVPLGAFLSGGLDSSIIVGLMSEAGPGPVQTFTIGFSDEPSYDERAHARLVASHFGTKHTEYVVKPKAYELVERLVWHHDQPYGDSSAIPSYIISEIARKDVTVALAGDGGDEVFAGYDRFRAAMLAARTPSFAQAVGPIAARLLPKGGGYFNLRRRVERFCESAGQPVEERYLRWTSIFGESEVAAILRPELRGELESEEIHRTFREVLERNREKPLLNRLLELNFETYLPGDLLVKMDRMSMAHSLETRSPFLDKDLVEYAGRLSPQWKVRGRTGKFILKRAFAHLLPEEILDRPKHGFGVPVGRWFHQELGEMYRDLVLDSAAESSAYVQRDSAERLFNEHLDGAHHGPKLWLLLTLEVWLRLLRLPVTDRPRAPSVDIQANE